MIRRCRDLEITVVIRISIVSRFCGFDDVVGLPGADVV